MVTRSDRVETVVLDLTAEIARAHGLELYDVVFRRSGPRWKLQVFLERSAGNVSLEDCEQVSRQLSHELDALDPIPGAYDLEVSSPGIERVLRTRAHWEAAQGKTVKVRWRDETGRTDTVVARLDSLEENAALVQQTSGESRRIELDAVLSARVHVEW